MNILYDFDFINEKETKDFPIGNGCFSKKDIDEALKAVHAVNKWSENSLFSACFHSVYIVLLDCPGDNVFAQVDGDRFTKDVFIELNVLNLIDTYYHDAVIHRVLFKKPISLFHFVTFFLLHELGHIVHCHIVMKSHPCFYFQLEDYAVRYASFHECLNKKYGFYYNAETDYSLQKEYRRIPSEKFSDSFARFFVFSF